MRYIVLDTNISNKELLARLNYLQEVYNVSFKYLRLSNGLVSYYTDSTFHKKLVFLVGHMGSINSYIKKDKKLRNKIVVIDSCYLDKIASIELLKPKKVFLSKNLKASNERIDDTGFNFGITKSEIEMYTKRNEEVFPRIKNVYLCYNDIRGKEKWVI